MSPWRASGSQSQDPAAVGGRAARERLQHGALRLRERRRLPALESRHLRRPAGRRGRRARRAHRRIACLAPQERAAKICTSHPRSVAPLRRRSVARRSGLGVRCREGAGARNPAQGGRAGGADARPAHAGAGGADRAALRRREPAVPPRRAARQRAREAPQARQVRHRPAGGLGGEAVAGPGGARARVRRAHAADRRIPRARAPAPAGRGARDHPRAPGTGAAARADRQLGSRSRARVRHRARRLARPVLRAARRHRPLAQYRAARPRPGAPAPLRRRIRDADGAMNDPKPLRFVQEPPPGDAGTAYAGRTRYTQLEYEALLGNLPLGIAFTRERRFFLCNPKFAEMFGYGPDELIGMAGEAVYPSSESYLALGQIAGPILAAGRQVDVEWEVKRKDGSTFVCRMIAKTLDAADPQQGTVWIVEDITERRRHADDAARLLREHEATLGTASVGIVFLKDRRIVRCNRRYEEMYGYAPGELVGKPTALLYARDEDLANAASAYDQLRRGMTLSRIEQRKRKDGSVFWTRAAGRAVDPQDPLKGSVWTVEDVTEQRRAEDELQRVLAEQQALLDNVVVGIAISRERKVVRCNRRFEEMFGFGAGEANGVSWRQMYFTEEEFELRGQVYADLDQGRTHGREQWLRRQDGSGFWCKVSGRAVAQGDPARGYVWLTEDISERRRADEALERLVREQDAVLQNAVTGIIFVKDRRIVRCNRRFEDIFGYAQGELLNRSTRFMFASDADYEAGGEALYEPLWRGETVFVERRHVRKDGSLIWCSLSGRAVQAGDPAQGSVWLFDDITQEHESEERVQRALAEQELILDNASVGIAFVRNRAIQRCNRFLEDMIGAGPGELIGQSTATLYASRSEWEEAGARAYSSTSPGGTYDAERRFKRRDGTTFICRVRGRRTDTGEEPQEWIWSYEDVTLEREAEMRVQRALAEQDVILDNATVGIAFLRGVVIQRCNRFLEEMAGVPRGSLVGKSSAVLFSANEDDWKRSARRAYEQTPPGGIHSEDVRVTRADGSSFLCHMRGRRIDAGEAEQEWIWSCDDVTAE